MKIPMSAIKQLSGLSFPQNRVEASWASAKVQMFVAKLTNVLLIYLANPSHL